MSDLLSSLKPKNNSLRTKLGTVFCDGGSRGNPGPAGAGAILLASNGDELSRAGRFFSHATNNFAEYQAMILGLELAKKEKISKLTIKMDSKLIVEQMKGSYKVKHSALKILHEKAHQLVESFTEVIFLHIPREKNKLADHLANLAMDNPEKYHQ